MSSTAEAVTVSKDELQRLIADAVAKETALRTETREKLKDAPKPKKDAATEQWFVDGEWVTPMNLVDDGPVGDTSAPIHKMDRTPAKLKPGYVWKWVRDVSPDGTDNSERIMRIQAYGGEVYTDPTTNEPLRRGRLVLMQWPLAGKAAFMRDNANSLTTRGRKTTIDAIVDEYQGKIDAANTKAGRRIMELHVEHRQDQETVSPRDLE